MNRGKKEVVALLVVAFAIVIVYWAWQRLPRIQFRGESKCYDVIAAPRDSLIAFDEAGQRIRMFYVSGGDTIRIPSYGDRVEVWTQKKKPERIKMEEEFAFSDRGGLVYVSAERKEKGLWIVHNALKGYTEKEKQEKEERKKEDPKPDAYISPRSQPRVYSVTIGPRWKEHQFVPKRGEIWELWSIDNKPLAGIQWQIGGGDLVTIDSARSNFNNAKGQYVYPFRIINNKYSEQLNLKSPDRRREMIFKIFPPS